MNISMDIELLYVPEPDDELDMDEFLDAVVEHMELLEVQDVSVLADLEARTVLVSLDCEFDTDPMVGVNQGYASLRTAIHACGGKTHGWPVFHLNSITAGRVFTPSDVDELIEIK